MPDSVVIGAALAQRPGYGGHAWALLQYAMGFRVLGFEVTVLDRLEGGMLPEGVARPAALAALAETMSWAGLAGSYSVLDGDTAVAGLPREEVLARVRSARFLLNAMGFVADPELRAAARRRVFLDIDPGFGQMWRELGLADVFAGHDVFVTVGRNVGRDDCAVPTCGLPWITLPHPVVLERCRPSPPGRGLTTVGSWRGPYAPVEYQGKTYGLRAHRFRSIAELPARAGGKFAAALEIDAADEADRRRLEDGGWTLLDPRAVAATPAGYEAFVRGSYAEVTAAKDMYVRARTGWLGDRTLCYLAHGRPALVEDTGLGELYPLGEGLLAFATLEEAIAGVEAIRGAYDGHARAARALAEREFDARIVLSRLVEEVG